MKRSDLEHILRAAGAISGDHEIVVIGSQAILGSFPDAPEELLFSCEADVYPKNKPELAILIEGAIGEESLFHQTFIKFFCAVRLAFIVQRKGQDRQDQPPVPSRDVALPPIPAGAALR